MIDKYSKGLNAIEEEKSFDDSESVISQKNTITSLMKSMEAPSTSQIIEIDRHKIFREELDKIQKIPLFSGIKIVADEDYFNFDKAFCEEIEEASSEEDSELRKAIEMEKAGYSKPGMSQIEIKEERKMFGQNQYSLDFMMDDHELQDDQEI